MGCVKEDGELHPYAAWLIRKKARQVIGKNGITESDTEDIEQELWLHVLQRQRQYDPGKAKITTFLTCIITNCLASIIEHRRAAKRSCDTPMVSLDEQVSEDSDLERQEVTDQDTYLQLTGKISRPLSTLQDLRIDVQRVIRSLPPLLRLIAALLQDMTITEVSEAIGIPRTTINEKRNLIRRIFADAGLDEYLEKVPSYRRRFR